MQILVVIGSTRPVRVGDQIADLISRLAHEAAGERSDVVVAVEDLAQRALPFLDEPVPAMVSGPNYAHQHTRDWASTITHADALVLVSPQYNTGYPASLKNAIDYLWVEWQQKPAAVVTYGSEFSEGGRHAQAQLGDVATMIGLDLVSPGVQIPLATEAYTAEGRLRDTVAATTPVHEELRGMLQTLLAAAYSRSS